METTNKLSFWKKLLVIFIILISLVLGTYLFHSCNQACSFNFNITDFVGKSFLSPGKNYILTFTNERNVRYVSNKDEEALTLPIEVKENIVYATKGNGEIDEETGQEKTHRLAFVVMGEDKILYQKINEILNLITKETVLS